MIDIMKTSFEKHGKLSVNTVFNESITSLGYHKHVGIDLYLGTHYYNISATQKSVLKKSANNTINKKH